MKATKKVILGLTAVSLLIAEYGVFGQPDTVKATSVPTAAKTLMVTAGKKKTITVKGDYIKSKTFKSSETSIATVSKKGVVTAKKAGNCNITVSVKYRKTKNAKKILTKKLICKVTVKEGKPTSTTNSTQTSVSKNESDVAAIKEIIAEQKALGATVSEDLDSWQYEWTDGRLTGIDWTRSNVQGNLSFRGLPQLRNLGFFVNELTGLDVSNCSKLTTLNCFANQLTSLDVSNCTALTELDCSNNSKLQNLDVSTNSLLTTLKCSRGSLTNLDISNNTALKTLYCDGNLLTAIDVSNNTALTTLHCYNTDDGNQNTFTSLDVSNCTALTELKCSNTKLTSLNVSNCTALTELDCSRTELTSLDVSNCTALTELKCSDAKLTSLDVSKNTALAELNCAANQLRSLDVSNCTALTKLDCRINRLTSLDVSNCKALTDLQYNEYVNVIGKP